MNEINKDWFNIFLSRMIYEKMADIVRPNVLQTIQDKYKNLNIAFMKFDKTITIADKLIFYTDGTETELQKIQEEYDCILRTKICEEAIKFVDKLFKEK